MKCLVYSYTDIEAMVPMLNSLTVTGIEQARIVSAIADILDTGKVKNIDEQPKKEEEALKDDLK